MKLSGITYKIAEHSDLSEILAIFEDTIRTVCSKDYSDNQIEAWAKSVEDKEKWKDRISNQYFILATLNEETIGFASLDSHACLDLLYVHKDYQSQGVATLLLNKVEAKARDFGYASIHTYGSITSLPFFENNNFKALHPNSVIVNGVELKNFKLVKALF